uniref:G-protein coupled receptors family 1 profile domain-containing protein n=1 Tax=Strigamia maritima TaxID=126957 RepID=T1IVU3_STRMM
METTTSAYRDITVILIINATIIDTSKRSSTGDWAAVTGLVFLSIPTFAFNALLVGTIGSSVALKRIPFYLLLLSLGTIHLIDSTLNLAVSLAFAARVRSWPLGRTGCPLNAWTRLFVVVLLSFQLNHLLVDRVLAVRKATRYKRQVTCSRQTVAIAISWFVSFVYTLPVGFTGVVDTRPFPFRYSCDLTNAASSAYVKSVAILAFSLPLIVTCLCVLYLLLVFYKDRKASRSSVHALSDNVLRQPLLWSELQLTHVALAVFTSYVLLQLPAIVNSTVDSLSVVHPFTKIPIKSNNTDNNSTSSKYRILQEVFHSPPRDTAFAWFRYLEALIYPLIVLALRKDIRNKARVLLTFWKPHSSADLSPRRTPYLNSISREKTLKQSKPKKTRNKLAHYGTPVLFATSEGLYLRVTQDSALRAQSGGLRFWLESGMQPGSGGKKPQFVCHVCDVWDAFDDIEDLDESEDKEVESRASSGALQRQPLDVDGHTPSDADSGVGDAESEDELPRSFRMRAVRFEEVPHHIVGSPERLLPRPSTVARLPPISEVVTEPQNENVTRKGLYVKNKRPSRKNRKKTGWNTSTKAGDTWSVMPTGHHGTNRRYRLN